MWRNLGQFILKNRFLLLFILACVTGYMVYEGSKVELSYELTKAIPVDHPKYKAYQEFKKNLEKMEIFWLLVFKQKIFLNKIFSMLTPRCIKT